MFNITEKKENRIDYNFTVICVLFVFIIINHISINDKLIKISEDISIMKQRIQWIESDVTDIKSSVK